MNKTIIIDKVINETFIVKESKLLNYEVKNQNTSLQIILKPNVKCTMVMYLYENINCECNFNINIGENSEFILYSIITTENKIDFKVKCLMDNINSKFNNMTVVLAKNNAVYHSCIDILHTSKYTSSNVDVYAIADNNASVVLDNNAKINKGCEKTIVKQKAKGLTLSKNSKIKALPNLYIDEYDVVANHAASIGSINPDDLFYLMSRGLSKEEASKIIIMGFINPLISCIDDESTKQMILDNFMKNNNLK